MFLIGAHKLLEFCIFMHQMSNQVCRIIFLQTESCMHRSGLQVSRHHFLTFRFSSQNCNQLLSLRLLPPKCCLFLNNIHISKQSLWWQVGLGFNFNEPHSYTPPPCSCFVPHEPEFPCLHLPDWLKGKKQFRDSGVQINHSEHVQCERTWRPSKQCLRWLPAKNTFSLHLEGKRVLQVFAYSWITCVLLYTWRFVTEL